MAEEATSSKTTGTESPSHYLPSADVLSWLDAIEKPMKDDGNESLEPSHPNIEQRATVPQSRDEMESGIQVQDGSRKGREPDETEVFLL